MHNVEKTTSSRRQLRNLAVSATFVAVCTAALATAIVPASAATNTFSKPKIRSKAEVGSVFITGKGHGSSIHGEDPENTNSQILTFVGSESAPVGLDACYTYWEGNNAEFVASDDLYLYINQAPGRQDTRPKNLPRKGDVQFADVQWLRGSTININTFTSSDCTTGLVDQFKNVSVPNNDSSEFELHRQ